MQPKGHKVQLYNMARRSYGKPSVQGCMDNGNSQEFEKGGAVVYAHEIFGHAPSLTRKVKAHHVAYHAF